MIIYVPTFDHTRKVQAIDSTKARLFKNSPVALTRFTICYYGTLYNGDNIYSTEAGAWADWQRDYKTAEAARVSHDSIEWAERR